MEKMLAEVKYCKKVMKNKFIKPLKMTKEDEENFKKADSCLGLYTFCSKKRLFCSKELLPKKAILLEIMLQKYYYALIMLLKKSIFLGSKYSNTINDTFYHPSRVRLTQHYLILKTNMGNNL